MSPENVSVGMVRSFTILFAEDDRLVRDAVVELLRGHGFTVLVAQDGYEAIRLLVEHPVDLMLTDIVMEGINGFELARQAKLMRPNLKVLYTTGYAEQAKNGDLRYGRLLEKPIRAKEIIAEISRALGV